ncbi:hypothetical protein VKT23_019533 [Stygiomarasmius scandens]|uniref:Uncharacterized protein n=1 Tax=Marasmiellus scandens TaxID=2682957 RepID=A0ABR1IQD3_9AGAR
MRSFSIISLVPIFLTLLGTQADIIGWDGDSCDGAQGGDAPCDGSCVPFTGRHSYALTTGGDHCITFFVNEGCSGERFFFGGGGGQCINVNTGTPIGAFRCSPNSGCAVRLLSNETVASESEAVSQSA